MGINLLVIKILPLFFPCKFSTEIERKGKNKSKSLLAWNTEQKENFIICFLLCYVEDKHVNDKISTEYFKKNIKNILTCEIIIWKLWYICISIYRYICFYVKMPLKSQKCNYYLSPQAILCLISLIFIYLFLLFFHPYTSFCSTYCENIEEKYMCKLLSLIFLWLKIHQWFPQKMPKVFGNINEFQSCL